MKIDAVSQRGEYASINMNPDNNSNENEKDHPSLQEDNDENDHPPEDPPQSELGGNDDDDADSNSSVLSDATVEPDHDMADSLSFAKVCERLETVWALKFRRKKPTLDERKRYLLPPPLLQKMESQSLFPLFRLLMPDIDSSRNTAMKEKVIAQAYCDVEGFAKGTRNYEMLFSYTDPTKVPDKTAGDLSLVVQHMLKQRIPDQPSKLTVGQVNELLDELAAIGQRRRGSYSHEWRESQNEQSGGPKKKKKETSISTQREYWLRKVMNKGLSPLEHKWLVRILLKKMEFGVGWKAILVYYNKFSMQLWNSHQSLKNLCGKLADPDFCASLEAEQARKEALQLAKDAHGANRWEPQEQRAALGNTIAPMRSSRVFFDDCMFKLQQNHAEYLKSLPPPAAALRESLALRLPAICAEIKYDGERFIAHVKDGQVTMLTRNGKWYSQLYSPVLGPPIRKALSKYRVNVILDGEVEAWGDGRQELIPFGNNRTVANARREYLRRNGLLESIDQNLHVGPDGSVSNPNVMLASDDFRFIKLKENDNETQAGKDCWLQFLVFDILYVDGPDAKRLFRDCLMEDESIVPGSLLHFTLLQRKIILHQLLTEQPNQVEIGKTVVIRPNGDYVRGEKYFTMTDPLLDEGGFPAALLDSTQTAIQGCMPPNILELDRLRCKGRSDAEICRLRSKAVEEFYTTVVEIHKMEGLLLKDLASPYILGQASKGRKYWHKFKPDYEQGESIDVVIMGAFFATGLRNSGRFSSFLCGIVDENDATAFMPLLNINGGSISHDKLKRILELTGYRPATDEEPFQAGKWFETEEPGKTLPDFISHRSYQRSAKEGFTGWTEDFDGWTFSKKTYPDLWIHPDDSFVLEIKGQEFVKSDEYSAGLTMRFPRIKRVRHDEFDGDAKTAYDADTHRLLFQLYCETFRQRQEQTSGILNSFSHSATSTNAMISFSQSRFLTPEEYTGKKTKRKGKTKALSPAKVPKVTHVKSRALAGVSFTVLEGNYSFDVESLEAQDAKDNGWYDEALKVKSKEDIMEFILAHSGKVLVSADLDDTLVLGGRVNDAKVIKHMDAIAYARSYTAGTKVPKTKKALLLQKIADDEGILKWTYVFSIVHRWLADQLRHSQVGETSTRTIKETSEWLLHPKAHDYLVKSSVKVGSNDHIFDLEHPDSITKIELLRALEEYGDKESADYRVRPWQYEFIHSIDLEDRRFLQSSTLDESYGVGGSYEFEAIIIYPDIFLDGFGLGTAQDAFIVDLDEKGEKRWTECRGENADDVASVLPLASASGAIVTPYLHNGVTHVLTDLAGGLGYIAACAGGKKHFVSYERGEAVISRLGALGILDRVKLVSPGWVRTQWRQRREHDAVSV